MPLRFLPAIIAALCLTFSAAPAPAQDQAEARKQLQADLSAMEKTARERLFTLEEWEKFSLLEARADDTVRLAEAKQGELDQSGKAELYRLFVRASRLEAAEKTRTLTPEQAMEKSQVERDILRLAEPLLLARLKELTERKESGQEFSLRETAVLDALMRWRGPPAGAPPAPAADDLSPRMQIRELIWVEQIPLMEEQGAVRRDLRFKDQVAEIYRLLSRRAESAEDERRDEALRRLSLWKTKRQ